MNKQVEQIKDMIEQMCDEYPTSRPILKYLMTFINRLPEEPVNEKGQAEEDYVQCYIRKFDKKWPILPSLKGKTLHEFKTFLNTCQQTFGLKRWGIHTNQAILFEKLTLLWATWGGYHLKNICNPVNKKGIDIIDEPVSEDLEEASRNYADNEEYGDDVYYAIKAAFKAGAKWQSKKEQDIIETVEDHAFLAGADWQKEQEMQDRLKFDNTVFQKFYDKGKADMKEQMMKDAVDAHIAESFIPVSDNLESYLHGFTCTYEMKQSTPYVKAGDKVKLIIVKED